MRWVKQTTKHEIGHSLSVLISVRVGMAVRCVRVCVWGVQVVLLFLTGGEGGQGIEETMVVVLYLWSICSCLAGY